MASLGRLAYRGIADMLGAHRSTLQLHPGARVSFAETGDARFTDTLL
ncbi:hypothetical protein NOR53_2424 [gamma proteobacterium NOR5-3]|nr:hypothetical protein NOR53_2424 [gamma proteobacterium NOR5-3]